MQSIYIFFEQLNTFLWWPPIIVLLLGTHIFLTLRLRFIQRYTPLALKLSFSKSNKGDGDVSRFASLSTALAATLGTGNIVGVATAVSLGGPGAVFWCWICGVLGMATNYSEALLAVKYRVKTQNGTMAGGPMYALSRGLGMKKLAKAYCVFTMLAGFGIGNMVQANSVTTLANETFGLNPIISGIVLSLLVSFVILGGVKSIAGVCEKLVPFMAVVYIVGCVSILIMNAGFLVPSIQLIFKSAFAFKAAAGGISGAAIRYGIARGLFTNEAGLGSAAIAAAAAKTKNPVTQALVSYTGTFWDTVVLCALTGLVIVSGMLRNPYVTAALSGSVLTKTVFEQLPVIGPYTLTIGLLTFVFATILGWSYYGERCAEYIFGKNVIFPYRLLWIIAVFIGSISAMPFVWNLADILNILMALPNIVCLLLLSGVTVSQTRKYLWDKGLNDEL